MSTNVPINPMMAWFQRQHGAQTNVGAERRRDQRYPTQHALTCALGDLVDLSTSGMRVIATKKPLVALGQELDLSIQSGKQKLALHGVVVRLQRRGLRKFDIGIRFIGVDDAMSAALEALAQYGYIDMTSSAFRKSSRKTGSKRQTSGKGLQRVNAHIDNPYDILGVQRDASDAAIRKAYSKLAFKYHPDVSNEPESAKIFKRVHDAYSLLRDPDRKRKYDAMLSESIG